MAEISTAPTNAELPATEDNGGGDSGLDNETKTLAETQATTDQYGNNVGIPILDETGASGNIRRNPETGELYDTGGVIAPTSAGVGSNDDSGGANSDADAQEGGFYGTTNASTSTATKTVTGGFNNNSRAQIIPQPNVLDRFSSYTYRLSVYLMTPDQYKTLALSHKKQISSYNLLFQSGGAPTNQGGFLGALGQGATATAGIAEATAEEIAAVQSRYAGSAATAGATAGRNPAFPLDFYIDNCTIVNTLAGKGTSSPHSVVSLKFTVIEPMGITLLDRMYEAVQDSAPTDGAGKVNYTNAHYLMVVRFYGYDQNGNIVQGSPNSSDPRAVVEKYIPFKINKVNWRVSAKSTEYEFDCTAHSQIIAGGTRRGVVPYDIQLSQGTVGKILGGNPVFVGTTAASNTPGASTTSTPVAGQETRGAAAQQTPPAKANTASTPKQTVKQGLMAAMNDFSQSLTTGKNPVYEIADQYEIVFAKGAEAIRDATIVLPSKEARLTPMNQPATANSQNLDPETQKKDTSIATKSITAGQPIVQVIDQIIRNSSYITNQALTIINEENEEPNNNNKQKQKPVDWFQILFEAIPIGNKQDSRRNDYAYKIRYIIVPYRLESYDSKYFPLPSFRGVHKSYPWIFTGKNTAVLDYSETLNSAYTMLVSGSDPTNSDAERTRRKIASSMRDIVTYSYGPRSGETNQGSRYKSNELGANLADSLNAGGGDLANTQVRIIGDPAWMQQGSIAGGISPQELNYESFLPDGTINFETEQVLFEVTWNRPVDYNIETGIADPNFIKRPPISRVYTAVEVSNEFRQGKFEQVLKGTLYQLVKPDGSNKAPTAPMPNKSDSGRRDATAQSQDATNAIGNSRQTEKPAAGVGETNTTARPEPAVPLPVDNQQVNTSTIPPQPADTAQPSPPPEPSSSGTGESIAPALNELGQPSRFRTNPETGELYDPGQGGVLTTPQTISRET